MALLDLLYEVTTKQLAYGPQGPLGFTLPTLKQEGVTSINLTVIKRTSLDAFGSTQYEMINISAWSLRLAIGTAGSVLAQQNVFTPDSTNTKFVGTLSLNTAGINALTDRQTGIFFEILLTDAVGGIDGKRFDCVIEKAIFTTAAVITSPTDTALTELKAARLYVLKEGNPGEGFILKSADGTQKVFFYLHDDGSFRQEAIT